MRRSKEVIILRRNLNAFNRKTMIGLKIEPVKWQLKRNLSIRLQNEMKVKELGLKSIDELPSDVRKLPHKNKLPLQIPIETKNLQIIISLGYVPKTNNSKKRKRIAKERFCIVDGLTFKERRRIKRKNK